MASPLVDANATPNTPEYWRGQIKASEEKRDPLVEKWRENVQRYLAKTLSSMPTDDTIVVPLDYANTEQKKAQLFFRVPELHLTAKRPEYEAAVPVFQGVINHTLGRHGVDAKTMMDEVLFDALCPSGLAVTKIGYEPTIQGTKTVPDPVTGRPMPDPNDPTKSALVPNVIHESYYWNRISPEKVLIPADFTGSNYDRAPWLGFEFEMDFDVAKRTFNLPDDFTGGSAEVKVSGLNENEQPQIQTPRKKVTGQELWYRLASVDPNEPHPEKLGKCVLIDGLDGFAEAPHATNWQRFQPDGSFIGIKGFPIHIRGARYVSDSAYPPSDVQMAKPQVEELSKGRTQMIRQRDRNLPMRWADRNRVDKQVTDRLAKGDYQAIILTDGPGNEQIGEVARAQFPRENFEFDRIVKRDLDALWALGSNQRGQDDDTAKTATESSIIQSNADARLAYEQDGWLDWFVRGAEKLGALIQVFADDTDYVPITGPDGVITLTAWDRTRIAGEFVFSAKPDTALRQDQATARKRATEIFQFQVNNPHVNKAELTKWYLREQNLPDQLFQPTPPESGPDPAKFSVSITGEDLSPLSPQAPIVAELLVQFGLTISPGAIQKSIEIAGLAPPQPGPGAEGGGIAGEPPHGGTATPMAPLNKHAADESGRLPGKGQAAAVN